MFEDCKIEFYISPGGDVYVDDRGRESVYKLREDNHGLISYVATLIERQYPEAYRALVEEYRKSKPNTSYHRFLMVHRFIRCNFATYDGLRNDIEDNVLHIESVTCPLKWRGDCPLQGVVCNPKPLGLSKRASEHDTPRQWFYSDLEWTAIIGICELGDLGEFKRLQSLYGTDRGESLSFKHYEEKYFHSMREVSTEESK